MPSPIQFRCSVLGSSWSRGVWAQSSGPAARAFADAYRNNEGRPLPAWRVIKLEWEVPSGKFRGQPREAHYLWQDNGSVNRYVPKGATDPAYQDKPLPEPSPAYLWT